jgi:hypothetical protein
MRPRNESRLWWLVDQLSAALDPREREVIRGDLCECNSGARTALREILGLVLRRQAVVWFDWRPWLGVVSVVIPVGLLLSHASLWWGVGSGRDIVHYWKVWDFSYFAYPGWRNDVIRLAVWMGASWFALFGWSWTSGFVVGRISRRTVWVLVSMFALVIFGGTLGTLMVNQRPNPSLQYHLIFVVLPRLVRTFLVLLPMLWGAYRGVKRSSMPLMPTLIGVLVLTTATVLSSKGLEGSVVFGRGRIPQDPGPDGFIGSVDDPRPLWFLSLVMLWPAAYILVTTGWQRWQQKGVVA